MAISIPLDRPITADELANFPDDGNRYEVIGGVLEVSPSPSYIHQRISSELSRIFGNYFAEIGGADVIAAPMDVYLGVNDLVQPDLIIVSKERAEIIRSLRIEGAPDLVVEILSPTSQGRDLISKAALYARSGVMEYWIVDPQKSQISVKILRDGSYLDQSSQDGIARSQRFPGLVIDPEQVFALPEWLVNELIDEAP